MATKRNNTQNATPPTPEECPNCKGSGLINNGDDVCTVCEGSGVKDGDVTVTTDGTEPKAGTDDGTGKDGSSEGQGKEYSPTGNTSAPSPEPKTASPTGPNPNEVNGSDDGSAPDPNEGKTVVGVMVRLYDDDQIKQADDALAALITAARALRAEHTRRGNTYSRIFVDNVVSAIWKFDHTICPCPHCNGTGWKTDDATETAATCRMCDGDGIGNVDKDNEVAGQ